MNWVDIIIVLVVSVATFSSLRTGFLRQVMSLMGLVVGFYAALTHHATVARPLQTAIGNASIANIVAFVVILIVVWWAFATAASLAHRALKSWGLAWADHFMGMLVGLLAGLFFSVCFLLLFIRIPMPAVRSSVQQSALASWIFQLLPHLGRLLPSNLRIFTVI